MGALGFEPACCGVVELLEKCSWGNCANPGGVLGGAERFAEPGGGHREGCRGSSPQPHAGCALRLQGGGSRRCCCPPLQEHVYIYLLDGDTRLTCDDPPHELPAEGKLR